MSDALILELSDLREKSSARIKALELTEANNALELDRLRNKLRDEQKSNVRMTTTCLQTPPC